MEIAYIIIIIALIASAFFSGSEIAFVTANRLKIELDSQKGAFSGKLLAYFVKHDNKFIAALLLGNNIALVIYGIWMAQLLEPVIENWVTNTSLVLTIQTIFSTLLILFTAEFLPKATFQINPNRTLQFLALPLMVVYIILYPFTLFTIFLSNGILKLAKIDTNNGTTAFSKVDLDDYVKDMNERMNESGVNELENEMQILQNALGFSEVKARDCMIPRTDMVALDIEEDIAVLKKKFVETGLSKIIIYRDSIDNVIGYTHSYDLFKKPEAIKNILLPISFVPEAIPAKQLLEQFAKQSGNISIVVDEFGGTSGLVTIEDVIEEIFGDIEDEHDKDQLVEEELEPNIYMFSARQEIDYLNDTFELNLEESPEYETLGGLVIHHLETIPKEGEVLELENCKITIKEVSDRRIELVIIERIVEEK